MDRERSATRYHRLQLLLAAIALLVGASWLLLLTLTGLARFVAEQGARVIDRAWWTVLVVSVATGAGHTLVTAPLAIVKGYVLPRRFDLLHQPFSAWVLDRLKAAALGGAIGLAVIEVIYVVIAATPHWWIVAGAFVAAVSLLGAVVFPVWIVPLFYRLTPLADQTLAGRLETLARRAGVPVIGCWVVDQSRKSRTVNAAVAGLGRTRRVILFDTLLDTLGPGETEAVLAHELGHHARHDMWRGFVAHTILGFLTFWAADQILRATAPLVGLDGLADPSGVPWLALVLGLLGLVTMPIANTYSRAIERRADDFALRLTGDAGAFVGAMERLADLNLAERNPPRLEELFLFSHPSIGRRIARARAGS
jgi:STE24 endopeptidase